MPLAYIKKSWTLLTPKNFKGKAGQLILPPRPNEPPKLSTGDSSDAIHSGGPLQKNIRTANSWSDQCPIPTATNSRCFKEILEQGNYEINS